jgi:5-hydroxyisourate hydrolase
MGTLTTHVLDTANGVPAAGMAAKLYRIGSDGSASLLKAMTLDADGRADGPLLAGDEFQPGRYRLVFAVGDYFRRGGAELADPPFSTRCRSTSASHRWASTTTCRCSPARGRTRPYRGS